MREETVRRPKPLAAVGDRPLLWHIIMHFIHYGFRDFIIAAGYRCGLIEDFAAARAVRDRAQSAPGQHAPDEYRETAPRM